MLIRGGSTGLGPVVVPGPYQVRVIVDGESQTASFHVVMDPRLEGVSEADLNGQFDFAMHVHQRVDDATSAVALIREIKQAVDSRIRQAADRRVTFAGESFKNRLSAIEEQLYVVGAQSQKSPLHLGGGIVNKIAHLSGVIRSADTRPTEQTYAVFAELSAHLDVRLLRLEQVLTEELDRLNNLLEERGLDVVHRSTPIAFRF